MKKKFINQTFIIFLILILCSFVSGCKKKEIELSEQQKNCIDQLNFITFEISCYNLTGKCSVQNAKEYYHPQALTEILSKKVYEKGNVYYLIEKLSKNNLGTIDSLGFYSESNDNGSWVDDILIKIEEERIADEISAMEDTLEELEEFQEPEVNPEEEITKALDEEIEEKELLDSTNELKIMEFDKEIFIPQKINDGWVLIHSVNGNTTRSFYDKSYRLTKKEIWNIKTVDNSKLIQTEESIYEDDKNRPSKIIVSNEDGIQEINYTTEGFISFVDNYIMYEDEKIITSKLSRIYDDENRILSEESVEYKYKDEKYKKIDYKFTKKHVYKYNEGEDIPPDFEYFEDNVLKMKNKYSTEKGNYTSQIFFEGGFSVKTYYEEELKVRDVFYQNDEVTREKIYER